MMTLDEARRLLRSPRELTAEQWRQAYEVIQSHNIWRTDRVQAGERRGGADDRGQPSG